MGSAVVNVSLTVNLIKARCSFPLLFLFKLLLLVSLLNFSTLSYALTVHPAWLQQSLDKADKLNDKNPVLALEFAQDILDNPKETLNIQGKAALYSRLAEYHYYLDHLSESQRYIDLFYALKASLMTSDGITLLITHGGVLQAHGETKQGMELYLQAKDNAEETENKKQLADSYSAIATSFSENYNDSEALKYYHKAYLLTQALGDELEIAYLNIQMARSYSYIYDDDKAIDYAKKAIEYFHANKYYYDELLAHNTLASVYMQMLAYDDAIASFQSILETSKLVEKESLIDLAYLGFAKAYFEKKEMAKAKHYFQLYQQHVPPTSSPYGKIDRLMLSSKIAFANKDISMTEENIKQMELILASLEEGTNSSWQIAILDLKSNIAVFNEDYKNAYELQKAAHKLFSSYENSEREKVRSKFKVMFDTDQALLKNQILERDKLLDKAALENADQQQKLQTLIILAISLFALVLGFFIYRQLKSSKMLHKLANTDTLTELANRRYTFIYAENKLSQIKQNSGVFSLVIFDIDHFKSVNDTYGHAGGDIALKDVSVIANEYVRNNDVLGRIGGEEFLIVLPHASAEQANEVAERIRQAIDSAKVTIDGKQVHITASFGIAQLNNEHSTFNQIFHQADIALYQAKNSGRNCIKLAD